MRRFVNCSNSYYRKVDESIISGINIIRYECSIDVDDIVNNSEIIFEFDVDKISILDIVNSMIKDVFVDEMVLFNVILKDDEMFLMYKDNEVVKELMFVEINLIG